jgi:sugar phosphate isomerase/epimerase
LVVDALKELAGEALDRKVTLSLQPMRPEFKDSWTFLHNLDETLDLLDRVNHPAVQLAFDTYHLGQERGLLNRLPELVPFIGVVQASDSRTKVLDEYDRVLPGEGVLSAEAIVSGLIDAGYRGFVDYQIWSEDCWRSQDLSWLHRCRDNFSRLCPVIHSL